MPKPYSHDLRLKVLQAIQLDGLKKCEASQLFSISRNTIDLWLKRQVDTGDCLPRPTTPKHTSQKITDWQAFAEFVQQHPDKTQAQIAALWPTPISARTISRGLRTIGFTRKKKPTATANAMRLSANSSLSS